MTPLHFYSFFSIKQNLKISLLSITYVIFDKINGFNSCYFHRSINNKATGIVPQSLFKNFKILDLENTLVVEIQKGILLYSCHIVRKFLNIDTEHKTQKSQMWRQDAGNYVDKHCTIT
jgi:hypothetical protein